MSKSFNITILGSNSALPTSKRYPTAQVLNVSERFFLIDCGEGTQVQLRANKIKFSKINHIFISHLHGDHCFGLIGLISTYGLLGRKSDLHIYAHPDLEKIMTPQLEYFCDRLPFNVVFNEINPSKAEQIYTDKHMTVDTIPLDHRIPTCGFLFREHQGERKINKEFVFSYQPSIKEIISIKKGGDYLSPDGEVLINDKISKPGSFPRSYAFCTDTRIVKKNIDQIKGIDLLYHETTFTSEQKKLAKQTYHSTTDQAAELAKLAGVKKLLIGHFSSRYRDLSVFEKEARAIFPPTDLATEGSVFFIDQ